MFPKLLPQVIKINFQNTFLKFLPQKIHFQNSSLTKYFFKIAPSKKKDFEIAFSKNINRITLIYSSSESSESSEELSKSSIICLITFFFMYLHSFRNT